MHKDCLLRLTPRGAVPQPGDLLGSASFQQEWYAHCWTCWAPESSASCAMLLNIFEDSVQHLIFAMCLDIFRQRLTVRTAGHDG